MMIIYELRFQQKDPVLRLIIGNYKSSIYDITNDKDVNLSNSRNIKHEIPNKKVEHIKNQKAWTNRKPDKSHKATL